MKGEGAAEAGKELHRERARRPCGSVPVVGAPGAVLECESRLDPWAPGNV